MQIILSEYLNRAQIYPSLGHENRKSKCNVLDFEVISSTIQMHVKLKLYSGSQMTVI